MEKGAAGGEEEADLLKYRGVSRRRGPKGAVMFETRDLGTHWPQWCTLLFEGRAAVDMRVVCPQDVKSMLLKQARMVYWKRWAAKHECEEMKEGVCLKPIQAVQRRKTNESPTDKQRNVMRKLVVEEDWVQQVIYDTGWSDEKKCRGCDNEKKVRRSTGCTIARPGEDRKSDPRGFGDMGTQRTKNRRRIGSGKES